MIPGTPGAPGTGTNTPRHKFVLFDLTLHFPLGELSLICGKLGAGKTLLLLALLGEADVLTGQLICPRSPPDAIMDFANTRLTGQNRGTSGLGDDGDEEWIVPNMCAYVPQTAWLQNASIKENILFNLPYREKRYQDTLEVSIVWFLFFGRLSVKASGVRSSLLDADHLDIGLRFGS
jgi:ABC-type multidrug transport system fused ATPase/permease subunit